MRLAYKLSVAIGVVTLLAVIGGLVFTTKKLPKVLPVPTPSSLLQATSPVLGAPASAVPEGSKKIVEVELRYTNTAYNFSFGYPGNWKVFYNGPGDTVEIYKGGNRLAAGFSLLVGNVSSRTLQQMLDEQKAAMLKAYPKAKIAISKKLIGGAEGLELRATNLKVVGDFYTQPSNSYGKTGIAFRTLFEHNGKLFDLHGAYVDAADGEVISAVLDSIAFSP